jgi:hypothetical protein
MPTTVDPAISPQRGLGDALAAAGGLVLFVSMFIVWYGVGLKEDAESQLEDAIEQSGESSRISVDLRSLEDFALDAYDRSAWQAFSILDIVLALIALAVVALAVARLLGRAPDLPISPGILMAALAGLALLIVLIRIAFTPALEIDRALVGGTGTAKVKDVPGFEVERHFWGPLFGVLGSLAMIGGGLLAAGGRSAVDAVRAGQVRGERPLPPIEPEPAAPEAAPVQPPSEEAPATESGTVHEPREGGGEDQPGDEPEDRDDGESEDRS